MVKNPLFWIFPSSYLKYCCKGRKVVEKTDYKFHVTTSDLCADINLIYKSVCEDKNWDNHQIRLMLLDIPKIHDSPEGKKLIQMLAKTGWN